MRAPRLRPVATSPRQKAKSEPATVARSPTRSGPVRASCKLRTSAPPVMPDPGGKTNCGLGSCGSGDVPNVLESSPPVGGRAGAWCLGRRWQNGGGHRRSRRRAVGGPRRWHSRHCGCWRLWCSRSWGRWCSMGRCGRWRRCRDRRRGWCRRRGRVGTRQTLVDHLDVGSVPCCEQDSVSGIGEFKCLAAGLEHPKVIVAPRPNGGSWCVHGEGEAGRLLGRRSSWIRDA
jgi:hypothetical protein